MLRPIQKKKRNEIPGELDVPQSSLRTIEFDPFLEFGDEKTKHKPYENFITAYNDVLNQQGLPSMKFDGKSYHNIDRTQSSDDLELYNSIGRFVEANLNTSPSYEKTVPASRREETRDYWTDHMYGLVKTIQKKSEALPLSDKSKNDVNFLLNEYMNRSRAGIRGFAQQQTSNFNNSVYPSMGENVDAMLSSMAAGVDLNMPSLGEVMGKDFGVISEQIRKQSKEQAQAKGYGTMSTEEMWNDATKATDYGRIVWNVMNNAFVSFPQQIPSLISSVPNLMMANPKTALASFLVRGGSAATGLGLGYLQESGAMVLDIQEEYQRSKSRAKSLRETMLDPNHSTYNPKRFNELFTIQLNNGVSKTIDQMTDDEIRQASESIAKRYGGFSTALEVANTAGDIFLGKYAGTLNKLINNPKSKKSVVKSLFASLSKKPYVSAAGFEGLTEGGQEFTAEYMKSLNIPEYDISIPQIIESSIIGSIYGTAFKGFADIGDAVRGINKTTDGVTLTDTELESSNKTAEERAVPKSYDNDLIVGMLANENYEQAIADKYDVSVDEVKQREVEILAGNPQALLEKNVKEILSASPEMLEDYGWNNPYPEIKTDITEEIDELPGEESFDIDEASIEAYEGNNKLNNNVERDIILMEINNIDLEIRELQETNNPTVAAENQKRYRIAELEERRRRLIKESNPDTIAKKRQKKIIETQQKKENVPVIGKDVILRTPALGGTKAKIIGTLSKEGRDNIMVVELPNKQIKKISVSNMQFVTQTSEVMEFQKGLKGFKKGSKPVQKQTQAPKVKLEREQYSTELRKLKSTISNIEAQIKNFELQDLGEGDPPYDTAIENLNKVKIKSAQTELNLYKTSKQTSAVKKAIARQEQLIKSLKGEPQQTKQKEIKDNTSDEISAEDLSTVVSELEKRKEKKLKELENESAGLEKDFIREDIAKLEEMINERKERIKTKQETSPEKSLRELSNEYNIPRQWMSKYLGALKKPKPALFSILQGSKVVSTTEVDKGSMGAAKIELIVQIKSDLDFHIKQLNKFKNKIEEIFSDVYNSDDAFVSPDDSDMFKNKITVKFIKKNDSTPKASFDPKTDKTTGGMSEVKEDIETDDDGYIESLVQSADAENYVDPEDMDASETVKININNIIRETKETTEETQQEDEGGFTEEEAKEAVIEFTGRGINDLFEDLDDTDIDSDEDTELFSTASSNEIRLTGGQKKRFDKNMHRLWKQAKDKYGLTESQFLEFVEMTNPYWEKTPFADNWRLWSETKLNSSKFKQTYRRTMDKISRGIGDFLTGESAMEDEFKTIVIDAFEYVRENIGDIAGDIENTDQSVKDYTKIARTFWVRYNYNITPEKAQKINDTVIQLINDDPENAFENSLIALSDPDFDLVTPEGFTLAEQIKSGDGTPRRLFRRYFNAVHNLNSGTSNKSVNGDIVEWEGIIYAAASETKDTFDKDGKLKPKIGKFRATGPKGFDGNTRPEVGLKRFYTRFITKNFFSMMKAKDIYRPIKLGKTETGRQKWGVKGIYGFISGNVIWNLYRDGFVKNGLVPISSRGEDGKLILASITDETRNAQKNIKAFLREELKPFLKLKPDDESKDSPKWNKINRMFSNMLSPQYFNMKEQELFLHVFKGDFKLYQQHAIQRHLALKELFGSQYVFMKPEVIMKRIKIPFTPVTTSPSLPSRKVMYIDSATTSIRYVPNGGETANNKAITVPLQQMIDGEMQYIGDGQTLTSESVFAIEYPEHFGTDPDAKRAKTVQYVANGDNVHAAKHQEMTLDLGPDEYAEFVDQKGKVIATAIRDTNGHVELYNSESVRLDHLMTNDEAKIHEGDYTDMNTVHELPGTAIGMIQFSPPKQKNSSMFSSQLSYYIKDKLFQQAIMDKFDNIDQNAMSPKNIINRILKYANEGEAINKLLKEAALRFYDVVPQNIEELGNLGVGRHPSINQFLKEILKNKVLKPLADFKMNGSHLDFRADYKGRVNDKETIIGANPGLIKEVLSRAGNPSNLRTGEERLNFVNNWLKKNKFYTMIVRHPVASSVGYGLYRIKEIDPTIGDSFIISPREVKERFEGDHDHDTAHLVWLDDEFYGQLKKQLQPTKGLALSKYRSSNEARTLDNISGTLEMIDVMTYGETAIGEIVNTTRFAGALNSMFGRDGYLDFTFGGKLIRVKATPLDMIVKDDFVIDENGKPFEGKLEDLLRLYLQASVDHPKVLLLKDWKYSVTKIRDYLFYDPTNPDAPLPDEITEVLNQGFLKMVLGINSVVDNQRQSGGMAVDFDTLFNQSMMYSAFVEDRKGFLLEMFGEQDRDSDQKAKELLQGFDALLIDAKFAENSDQPTSLQEKISVSLATIIDRFPGGRQRFFNTHYDLSTEVHRLATRQTFQTFKDELADLADTSKDSNLKSAQVYAQQLGDSLAKLFESKKKNGETESISFLDKMTSKTWDYSKDFITFYNTWSKKFAVLDEANKKAATFFYLNGVIRGEIGSIRKDLRTMPPVKEFGETTLDPDIIREYFKNYNDILSNQYKDSKYLTSVRNNKVMSHNQMKKELGCGR